MRDFLEALRIQRWDDHRYYHHSTINQALHLVSALSFVFAYAMLFKDPAVAVLVAWLIGMTSRQIGHFFFEPRDYDTVNQASHEHKEEIKVGYNLQRKVVLMSIWAASPVVLYLDPTLFGLFTPHADKTEFVRHVALLWLGIGVGGLPVGRAERRDHDNSKRRGLPAALLRLLLPGRLAGVAKADSQPGSAVGSELAILSGVLLLVGMHPFLSYPLSLRLLANLAMRTRIYPIGKKPPRVGSPAFICEQTRPVKRRST